ncbi:MAG TPA: PIN domain-containing protein [archaeon]|jgi:predicted nucleic acid-binding protein|nr:PIN domain-containing protein [archaeon]
MTERFLIDTNILVYAFTDLDIKKKEKARETITFAQSSGQGYISKQNIIELINTTHKLKIREPNSQLCKVISGLEFLRIIDYSTGSIKKALDLETKANLDFFDSLIVQTMLENDIYTIYTENEKHFNRIENLKVINPFK